MKRIKHDPRWLQIALTIVLGIAFIVGGCGRMEAPTASSESNNSHGDLWNPQLGDEIIPGQEVPLLNPGYWEAQGGFEVNPNQSSAVIGPAGGQVRLGKHRLVVPAGAVNSNVTFTMSYASESGIAVDCGPGRTFQVPVLLTLSFKDTQYDGDDNGDCDPSNLCIFFLPQDGSPVLEPSIVDLTDKSVTAAIDHFSRYILG